MRIEHMTAQISGDSHMLHNDCNQAEEDFGFTLKHRSIEEILSDHKLAALGDAYVNFIYSLALSRKTGSPEGAKVQSQVLAEALKRADLRRLLPARTDRHKQADGAEALLVYAWIKGLITIEDAVNSLDEHENPTEAFRSLIIVTKNKLRF